MYVKKEYNFDLLEDTWSGAKQRMEDLTDKLRDELDSILSTEPETLFGEEVPEETTVNDFLWFEDDTYAEWLGFDSADIMWEYCKLIQKGIDEDDLYIDKGGELTTLDLIEDEFEIYKSENDDWQDYYDDLDDYAEYEYEKFERN